MARKEVNIFSMSFLDLLSGALAAVIILFIVVPKMDAESKEAKETLEELNLQASELAELVDQLENSVDSSVYKDVIERIKELEGNLVEARTSMDNLSTQLEQSRENYQAARNRVANLDRRLSQASSDLEEERESRRNAERTARMFGIKTELAIVFQWSANADIDIHLYNQATGEVCYWQNPYTSFANYLRDVQQATNENYEMIYQQKLVPGTYDLKIQLYTAPIGTTSSVAKGQIVTFLSSPRERQFNLGNITATRTLRTIKSFRVSRNGIQIING